MKAVIYHEFGAVPEVASVPDPALPRDGVVLRVTRTGLCRSDWHAWRGHDRDVRLPHVGGHELAGQVVAVGPEVRRWRVGDRVTVPFVSGCGHCSPCLQGDPQVCDSQFQPGFTHWGSFAEYVALQRADLNVVGLPEWLADADAASLGCRFITAYRGLAQLGRLREAEWVAVHGCGGVGLCSILIARALGARPIAVDVDPAKLELARSLGAERTVNAREHADAAGVAARIVDMTGGGAHLSVEALGSAATLRQSVLCLGKRGRHVQIGLLIGEGDPRVPIDRVIAYELELLGSHGMAAASYPDVFRLIETAKLPLELLAGRTLQLSAVPQALAELGAFTGIGMTLIDPWLHP